jgi:hypothetical protein
VRVSGGALFAFALAALAAYAVQAALRWPPKAALFPLTMGMPLLVLALALAVTELRKPEPRPEPAPGATRGVLAVFAWMGGFIAVVVIFGFPAAVPLFMLSYLVLESREKWGVSVALAAAAWGIFHLLFERLLHFPFEDGLIRGWF